jgi:hypothetical protein
MPIHKAGATGNRNKELYRERARSNWIKISIATMPDYRVAAIFPDHFQSLTVALKNDIFY